MVIFKHEGTIISTRNQSLFLVISLLFFISFQPLYLEKYNEIRTQCIELKLRDVVSLNAKLNMALPHI